MYSYNPPTFTAGRFFLTLNSILSMIGPYIADFNETHVYNPNWPPHARFHNGQTMSMGLALGLLTLFLTYRPTFTTSSSVSSSSSKHTNPASSAIIQSLLSHESADTLAAALVGSVYWVTGVSAILYPGALAVDPEFGEGFPQAPLFGGILVLAWVGWALEGRRIEGVRKGLVTSKGA